MFLHAVRLAALQVEIFFSFVVGYQSLVFFFTRIVFQKDDITPIIATFVIPGVRISFSPWHLKHRIVIRIGSFIHVQDPAFILAISASIRFR